MSAADGDECADCGRAEGHARWCDYAPDRPEDDSWSALDLALAIIGMIGLFGLSLLPFALGAWIMGWTS